MCIILWLTCAITNSSDVYWVLGHRCTSFSRRCWPYRVSWWCFLFLGKVIQWEFWFNDDFREFTGHSGSWWFSSCHRGLFIMSCSSEFDCFRIRFYMFLGQVIGAVMGWFSYCSMIQGTTLGDLALFRTKTHLKATSTQKTLSLSRWTFNYHLHNNMV